MLTLWLYTAARGDICCPRLQFIIWNGDTDLQRWFMAERKIAFLFWQERCDQEGETKKTKCLAAFEKWLTAEDQSSWQPKCSPPRLTFCLGADSQLSTFSTSLSTAEVSWNYEPGRIALPSASGVVFKYQAFRFMPFIILTERWAMRVCFTAA